MTCNRLLLLLCLGLPATASGQYTVVDRIESCYAKTSYSSEMIARLRLGDLVSPVYSTNEPYSYFWTHVSVPGKGSCFIPDRSLAPFDSKAPTRALVAIVETAKRRYGYPLFEDWAAIFDLIERAWQGVQVKGSPRMEMLKLEVLERTARTLHHDTPTRPKEIIWLERNKPNVYFFDPDGFYTVRIEDFWAVHEKYEDHALADSLAWIAARQPALHDCEGDLSCYMGVHAQYRLEYLKRHPSGAYIPGTLNWLSHDMAQANEFSCPEETVPVLRTLFHEYSSILGKVEHELARELELDLEVLRQRCVP